MAQNYTYEWYIKQFENARARSEDFILSVDEAFFQQPPSNNRWSIAECYSHLINYGNLFFDNLTSTFANTEQLTENADRPFPPRWIFRKLASFFEPPYNFRMKTIKQMKPDPVSGYNRMELLDEYMNLQDRLISQLEKGEHRHVDLSEAKMKHPIVPLLKMTLADCIIVIEAHQRRHQWQAEKTLEALQK